MHLPIPALPPRRVRLSVAGVVTVLAATAVVAAVAPDPASASSPGVNGRIAYSKTVNGNTDVYALRPDGSAALRLTTAAGADTTPAYSADGQRIVWVRQGYLTRELWTMKADGTDKRKVTSVNMAQTCPAQFSPDGKRLAFTQTVYGKKRIWTVAVDGTTKRQAFTPPATTPGDWLFDPEDDCARWSPKAGAGLGYLRTWQGQSSGLSEIRINTGGSDRAVTALGGEGWSITSFDFSPNGNEVAYATCCYAEHRGLLVATVSAPTVYRELTGFGVNGQPAWSPDGRFVAVFGWMGGDGDGVRLYPSGGGSPTLLRAETWMAARTLSWQALPR